MATYSDLHVADSINQALQAGMSESSVDSQHSKAIAILQAKVANSVGESSALAAAVALLQANQKHIRDPRNA